MGLFDGTLLDRQRMAMLSAIETYLKGVDDRNNAAVQLILKTLIRIEGKENQIIMTEAELSAQIDLVQSEATSTNVDVQTLGGITTKAIADFKAWIAAQPPASISPAVAQQITALLTSVQTAHAAILSASATLAAADPGEPGPVVVPSGGPEQPPIVVNQ